MKLLLCLTLLFYSLLGFSQSRESTYLQTNKQVFETGEDLWFSATILNAQSLKLSLKSETLYVKLIREADEAEIYRELFEISSGFVEGHLLLPDTLQTGRYNLVAYTPYSVIPSEPIKSFKPIEIRERVIPPLLITAGFDKPFYESGEQLQATYKVQHRDGSAAANAEADIALYQYLKRRKRKKLQTDSLGQLQVSFDLPEELDQLQLNNNVREDDGHNGALLLSVPVDLTKKVQFNLMPEGGHLVNGMVSKVAFKAVDINGQPFEVKLGLVVNAQGDSVASFATEHAGMGAFYFNPKPNEQYFAKIVSPQVDSLYQLPETKTQGIQLSLQRKSKSELWFALKKTSNIPDDSVTLTISQRGVLQWQGKTFLEGAGKLVKVPIQAMSQGIVAATLSNSTGVIAERLVYINEDKRLNITTSLSKENFTVKEKAKLDIKVTDNAGNPVQTAFGLSLVDEAYKSPFPEQHILSYYLLRTELRGNVFEPAYYFDKENPNASAHLDLLMLTQGWRAYEWNADVFPQNELPAFPEIIYAEVKVAKSEKASRELSPGPNFPLRIVSTGGAFETKTDSLDRVMLLPYILKSAQGGELSVLALGDKRVVRDIRLISGLDYGIALENVFEPNYLNQANTEIKNWDDLPTFIYSERLDDVEVVSYVNSERYYGGYKEGEVVEGTSDYVCDFGILNCPNHITGRQPKAGEMVGVVTPLGKLTNMDGVKFNMVRYIPKGAKRPDIVFKGYYKTPAFYEPNYDKAPEERAVADYRNTLIWRPNVITDENGEASIEFFSSDIRNIFLGRIEAYGLNGQFGFQEFEMKVLK